MKLETMGRRTSRMDKVEECNRSEIDREDFWDPVGICRSWQRGWNSYILQGASRSFSERWLCEQRSLWDAVAWFFEVEYYLVFSWWEACRRHRSCIVGSLKDRERTDLDLGVILFSKAICVFSRWMCVVLNFVVIVLSKQFSFTSVRSPRVTSSTLKKPFNDLS